MKVETSTEEEGRDEDKVRQLEKTIAFLQSHHATTIRGLHEEIKKLQDAFSGKTLEKAGQIDSCRSDVQ